MKKLLFAVLMVFLFSCEKEATYCWKCELHSYWDSDRVISSTTYCDKTAEEIVEIEGWVSGTECVRY